MLLKQKSSIKVEEQFLHRHWVRNAATITRIWQTCDNNKCSQKDPSQQEHLKYITYGVRMSPGCLDFDKRRLCVITGLTSWTSDGSKLMRNWIALKWKVWITTKFPASHLAEKKWHTTELAFWERQYFCASDKKQDFSSRDMKIEMGAVIGFRANSEKLPETGSRTYLNILDPSFECSFTNVLLRTI